MYSVVNLHLLRVGERLSVIFWIYAAGSSRSLSVSEREKSFGSGINDDSARVIGEALGCALMPENRLN